MFCDSNYDTDKETIKSGSGLFATLGGTLTMCSSKKQRMITLSIMEAKYVELLACAHELRLVNILLQEISEV